MPYKIDPKTKKVTFIKEPEPKHETVTIRDKSDGEGLKAGQDVRINGRPGLFRVVRVHRAKGDGRSYDVVPAPNRAQRRG